MCVASVHGVCMACAWRVPVPVPVHVIRMDMDMDMDMVYTQTSSLPPHVDLRAIDAWLLSVRLRQHRSERCARAAADGGSALCPPRRGDRRNAAGVRRP